ncbi:response regulator transcription factor [Microbispora sp. RL4-1S]|uniref:Response regulator transcription factor n=1 Tax=Microbispora oryzae TaxID=2806554 RepID=A0A940WHE7_9ACTN|nr:response regulator transcription factor [Microbispora oryzae]MBP2702783.1 response regulator transcription factor [Microbispora oryzae]
MTSTSFEQATRTAPVNVAIFAGNEILRRGLETVLRQLPFIGRVEHCATPDDLDLVVAGGTADIVITAAPPSPVAGDRVKVLMLLDDSQLGDPSFAASLDVDGFVIQQELTAGSLGDAIRRMTAGEMPIPARLARGLLAHASVPQAGPAARRAVSLTARENATLSLLADGLSNKQIARRLSISEHGAKRLVASVLLKLDSPNRTTAVVTAIKVGLIEYA